MRTSAIENNHYSNILRWSAKLFRFTNINWSDNCPGSPFYLFTCQFMYILNMAEAGIFLFSLQLVESEIFKHFHFCEWSYQSNRMFSFISYGRHPCCCWMRSVIQVLGIRHYYSRELSFHWTRTFHGVFHTRSVKGFWVRPWSIQGKSSQ